MSTKAEYAISLHNQGYNCAQAVACTFCKEFGVDEQELFRIAEGFGLGMGMMEMCGALSGMMMVIGLANSVGDLKKGMPTKGSTYKQVTDMSVVFHTVAGQILILHLRHADTGLHIQDSHSTTNSLQRTVQSSAHAGMPQILIDID